MQKHTRLLYFLAILKFALPFFLQNAVYEPHRDEFLYLAEGHHMAWGFMEVPPLLSVFAWFTNLSGGSMFWVKFWPSLFGVFTFIITGKTILSLGGKSFAIFLGFLPFIFGAYLRVHYLFQPNFLEIFFWTIIAYSLVRYVQTQNNYWLYVLGVSVGLGMMSKYSVAFFYVSILFGLLLTRQRKIFANKHFYYAAIISLIIILPNIIWQYIHQFPLVYHMRELQETQLQYVSPVSFLLDQLLMNFPCVFIWITGLYFVSFSANAKPYRFIGLAYGFVIALLLIGHGKNYYSLGVYPILFAFGAYQLEQYTLSKRKILRYAFVLASCISGIFIIPILLPIFPPKELANFYEKAGTKNTGALRWEDQQNHNLPQDFADMQGWEEMTKKMAVGYDMLDSNEKRHCTLFCDNYGMAGAVNYYGKKYGLPQAYSDNASFLYWMPDSLRIENLVLITDDQQEMTHPFIKSFTSAQVIDSITNPFARERGDLIILFKGANKKFAAYFSKKMERKKAAIAGKPLKGSIND